MGKVDKSAPVANVLYTPDNHRDGNIALYFHYYINT